MERKYKSVKAIFNIITVILVGILISCSDSSTAVDTDKEGGDSNDPTEEVSTGVLEVEISTSSDGLDLEGYTLVLNNTEEKDTDIEDTVVFEELTEGNHEVELTGISDACSVDGDNPASVEISAGETETISFTVVCEAQEDLVLRDKIVYNSTGPNGGYNKIYAMNDDGSDPTLLYEVEGSNVWYPDVSPDGKSVIFITSGFIFKMNADGSNVTQLTTEEDYPDGVSFGTGEEADPIWSPDGTRIAFERKNDIFVMNADGSNQQNITNTPDYFEIDPSWSPDGEKLVYGRGNNSSDQDEGNLYIVQVDDSESPTSFLATDEHIDKEPSWSPNGEKIAFIRGAEGEGYEVYLIDVENKDLFMITNIEEDRDGATYLNANPVWSPDGRRIAFEAWRESNDLIHTVNPDGTDEVMLDNGTINQGHPSWGPRSD